MSAQVIALKVYSPGQSNRKAMIEIEAGWSSMRADINDLPQDMYEAIKEWVDGRKA
jgi:hypothetical protein